MNTCEKLGIAGNCPGEYSECPHETKEKKDCMNNLEKFEVMLDRLTVSKVRNLLNSLNKYDGNIAYIKKCQEKINEKRGLKIY